MSSCIDLGIGAGHLCYIQCNYCSTVLAVNVPGSSLLEIVPVRCGNCTSLLSVDMGGLFQPSTPQVVEQSFNENNYSSSCSSYENKSGSSSSSKSREDSVISCAIGAEPETMKPISTGFTDCGTSEKRQRAPSAYNRFIRAEIQRIKAVNPDISHREAFSAAAKNWAHLGLMLPDNNKRTNTNVDQI
uniref:YABBY transcription factor n=1 Tax=Pseudotsuga menziesii TaxID=3357 RepID=A0A7M1ILC4_PSEMZ|nr:YABBY transcription factor [Pseudotsuga menziesii]